VPLSARVASVRGEAAKLSSSLEYSHPKVTCIGVEKLPVARLAKNCSRLSNPNVHCRVHKSPPLGWLSSQTNESGHTLTVCSHNIYAVQCGRYSSRDLRSYLNEKVAAPV
jgi:hypothetical protein